MPQVFPALAAIGTAISASFAAVAGVGAPLAGTGLLASVSQGALITSAFKQLAVGVALSLLSSALTSKKVDIPRTQGGQKISIQFGETNPMSWIAGKTLGTGDLVYHGSFGEIDDIPNVMYVQVLEYQDFPSRFGRIKVNGEYVTLRAEAHPERGFPVDEYRDSETGDDFLWIKLYDGTQTVADAWLCDQFADSEHPYTDDMIGLGITYLVVTARESSTKHPQRPIVEPELSAWGHYDPRKDSSAGGTGAQRFNDWRTWKPSTNPFVQIYNVMRGVYDPITGEHLWGGHDIGRRDWVTSTLFAAMNECDRVVEAKTLAEDPQNINEPNFQTGIEVRFDQEPASVVEELLKSCLGKLAQVGGQWVAKAGTPGIPVFSMTDDVVLVTDGSSFDPFPQLTGAYNEITARYPEPENGWQLKDAPTRRSAQYLLDDKGQRNVANMVYEAVFSGSQVQRLQKTKLEDGRRFRTHNLTLGPQARALTPLDDIAWTSYNYGYSLKKFEIEAVQDLENGCHTMALREWDPGDYDWDRDLQLPTVVGYTDDPPPLPPAEEFAVNPWIVYDDDGKPKKSAIELLWTIRPGMTGLRFRVYKHGTNTLVPGQSVSTKEAPTATTFSMELNTAQAQLNNVNATYEVVADVNDGRVIIEEGIIGGVSYDVTVHGEPVQGRKWSVRKQVTAPVVKLTLDDFEDEVLDRIEDMEDRTNTAVENALEALEKSNEIAELVDGLGDEFLDEMRAIRDELAGLNAGVIQEIRGIAVAGLRKGYVNDPVFSEWNVANTTLLRWNTSGINYGAQSTQGFYFSSLDVNMPSGANVFALTANSNIVKQMDGVDPNAEYVILGFMVRLFTGAFSTGRFRVEWHKTGDATTTYVRGHAMGVNNCVGEFSRYGLVVDANRLQSRETIWKKPFTEPADRIRILFNGKSSPETNATHFRIDYFDLRGASDAEIKGYDALSAAQALIDEFSVTIIGPGGAIAAMQTSLRAEFGEDIAAVNETIVALTNADGAMATRLVNLEAQTGGNNLVKNPQFDNGSLAFWDFTNGKPVATYERGSQPEHAVIANMPAKYALGMSQDSPDTTYWVRAHLPQTVEPGERLSFSAWIAGPNSPLGNVTMQVRFVWYNLDGQTPGTPTTTAVQTVGVGAAGWRKWTVDDIVVPAGVSKFETRIQRNAGGYDAACWITKVQVQKTDRVAYALATSAMGVATDATSAIGTMLDQVEVEFDDFEAMVSAAGTALATADLAASTYVMRATAGGGDASIRLTAWSDEDGSGDAVLLNADNVFAPGTLSVGTLVVTDLGHNLVTDDQLQSDRDWLQNDVGWDVRPDASSSTASRSRGEARWTKSQYGGVVPTVRLHSRWVPCWPGRRLVASLDIQNNGNERIRAWGEMQFADKEGGSVLLDVIQSVVDQTNAGGTLFNRTQQYTAPAGAYLCRIIFAVDASANLSSVVRFYAPSIISNENASVLITPDGAFFDQLTARTAWIENANIVNLTVSRIKIANGSISNTDVGFRTTNVNISEGVWTSVVACSITKEADEAVFINVRLAETRLPVYDVLVSTGGISVGVQTRIGRRLCRLLRNGSVINGDVTTPLDWVPDISTFAGAATYTIQVFTDEGTHQPNDLGWTRTESYQIGAATTLGVQQVVK